MTGLRSTAAKFAAFAALSGVLLVILLGTMLDGLEGSTRTYAAEFTNVSGLRVGDDLRLAGVRVGKVEEIEVEGRGARVLLAVEEGEHVRTDSRVVMRYQNLLGQRYLALEGGTTGAPVQEPGSTIPVERTSPGFDLTALLNGFRPLFDVLDPEAVNQLATSLVAVLQGEGGTVEQLLARTAEVTTFLADRDEVLDQVLDGLTPVLRNVADQDDELRATLVELRALMTGLARDRQAIGAAIDGVGSLVGSTSALVTDLRPPLDAAAARLRGASALLARERGQLVGALNRFRSVFDALARITSYETAANVYPCTVALAGAGQTLNLAGGDGGPYSEVCR